MTDKAQSSTKETHKPQPTPQSLDQIPQQATSQQQLIQRAKQDSGRLNSKEALQLQRLVGNRAVNRLLVEASRGQQGMQRQMEETGVKKTPSQALPASDLGQMQREGTASLETEATGMGNKAIQQKSNKISVVSGRKYSVHPLNVIQKQFKDSAELRKERFIEQAMQFRLTSDQAEELYEYSGGNDPDPVTKLRTIADKKETMKLAKEYIAESGAERREKVFYVTIDLRNLAGLNAVKGHAGADEIFGLMSRHVSKALEGLPANYNKGFRQEGSRFGFMIVGDSEKLKEELIQNALIAARADWEKIKREQGLTNIPNPHPNGEKGINFDFKVEEITVAAQISERMAEEDLDESAHHEKVEGVTPSAHSAYQGAAPGIFKGQTEKRRETFMAKGRALNLTDDQVEQLYRITGRSEKEALTGFDQASDRPGTLLSAMELYKTQWPWVYAGYVEVDVKNLGGLNKNLPRGDANNVFKFMSDTTDQHVRSLKADVASFRHGGDEFSFIVVAKAIQIDKGILSRLLAKAQNEIDAYVKTAKYVQKKKQDITIDSVEEADITTLNQGRLPQKLLEASFKETQIQRIGTIVENENWMVVGKDTDWAILRQGTTLKTTHLPRELTLSEIPHSKSTPDKPRKPGTGIVWAVSNVQLSDNSPIDVVARADQEVESKKMQEK